MFILIIFSVNYFRFRDKETVKKKQQTNNYLMQLMISVFDSDSYFFFSSDTSLYLGELYENVYA